MKKKDALKELFSNQLLNDGALLNVKGGATVVKTYCRGPRTERANYDEEGRVPGSTTYDQGPVIEDGSVTVYGVGPGEGLPPNPGELNEQLL